MQDPVVSLDDVHVSLGRGAARVHILKGVSLQVARGEAVGLTGPSGSGKSTLLMVLAGLERAQSGTVTLDGTVLSRLGEDALARFRGAKIGIVFQSFHLIPTMTALENVAIPLELAGDPEAFAKARRELGAVGLGDRLAHYPAQLSGGEQQRVALARALAPNPSIIVADEPTGNLDDATGRSIVDLMFATPPRPQRHPHPGHARQRSGGALRPGDPHPLGPHRGRAGGRPGRPGRGSVSVAAPSTRPAVAHRVSLPVVLRLAFRDLRGGLAGFWIFLACIALGVTAITGVGSVADGLAEGLAAQGRTILGGDASFSLVAKPLDDAQTAMLAQAGKLSVAATVRAMARRADGNATLVDLKAVDAAYPLTGTVVLDPPMPLAQALAAAPDGAFGLVADATLAARLDVHVGDVLRIGDGRFVLRATLQSEPDKLAGGIAFGPRVLTSLDGLRAAGLSGDGSLVRWTTRVDLDAKAAQPVGDAGLDRFVDHMKAAFPQAGWEVRTRRNVSPEFDRNLARFTQFLTLVGLTALVVGGVGVANAVRATVERKRPSLAVLKALGAPGGAVFAISLTQVLVVAALGILVGLVAGAAVPFIVLAGFGQVIPFPLTASVYPRELAQGALYGLLTTLVFSLGALGRAHDIPVSALFRDQIEPDPTGVRWRYRAAVGVALAGLVGAVFLFTPDWRLSGIYIAATIVAFLLLRGVAFGLMRLARAAPHPARVEARLALANIHRPGALTPSVVLSLGLGLALLVTLTLIDVNIRRQISDAGAGAIPSFFFVDIPSRSRDEFKSFVETHAPGVTVASVPMMRGRIVALNDVPAERIKPKQGSAFALEGDRGITTADTLPDGSMLAAGTWWQPGYAGPPLVSFDKDLAKGLGLGLGDRVTVNVLGRNITATIANLRSIEWEKLGINFFMVFSPNTFAGAPHSELATATFPGGGGDAPEIALLKDVANAYPTVTTVRVKDLLETLNRLVGQLAVAIRGASGVTIAASILVLAGALAAGRRARVYDAVVLKVLGATRGRLLAALLMEYALLGAATALFGILAGGVAAWFIVSKVMQFGFAFAWGPAIGAAMAALLLTVGLGLAGTWRILGEKPAGYLRAS